jgi:hypothetical protein
MPQRTGLQYLGGESSPHNHGLLHGNSVPEQICIANFLPQIASIGWKARYDVIQIILDSATMQVVGVTSPEVLFHIVWFASGQKTFSSHNEGSSSTENGADNKKKWEWGGIQNQQESEWQQWYSQLPQAGSIVLRAAPARSEHVTIWKHELGLGADILAVGICQVLVVNYPLSVGLHNRFDGREVAGIGFLKTSHGESTISHPVICNNLETKKKNHMSKNNNT